MSLVEMPNALSNKSFTIMDGAFFSLMPFPAKKSIDSTCLYTLSHVRNTPHISWMDSIDSKDAYDVLATYPKKSHYIYT